MLKQGATSKHSETLAQISALKDEISASQENVSSKHVVVGEGLSMFKEDVKEQLVTMKQSAAREHSEILIKVSALEQGVSVLQESVNSRHLAMEQSMKEQFSMMKQSTTSEHAQVLTQVSALKQ